MPVTIAHALTATTPDNPAYEVKPSNWNQSHQVTMSAVGSEIIGAFANSPSVTFGLSNGSVTASAVGGGGGGGNLAVSAGSTSQIATGLTFSNSNGVSWGINAGTITGSVFQSNQTDGFYVLGNSTLASSGTMDARSHTFSAAGLVSIGISNGSIVVSGAAGTGSGVGVSAGTQSISNGVVTFSNSNGVSFGLNAGVLTATVNPGPSAGIAAGADGAGHSQTTGSLVFSNSNGLTFGVSTGAGAGTITGSYTVPTVQINVSAGTTSGNQTGVTFSNSNGVSFGFNAGTVTASIAAAPVAASGSNGSFAFSTLSFGNLNGLTHYTSNGSLVGSYTVPVQSNQTIGLFGLSNTTQNTSGTVNATGMSFAGAGIISVGMSNGSVIISSPASTGLSQSVYATSNTTQSSSGTSPIGSLLFAGAGNVSIGYSNGSVVVSGATAAGLTTGGLYALGNTTQNSSTTMALTALSFNGLGAQTVGFSAGSIQLSVPATSSISATGQASVAVAGNTISIGVPILSLYATSNTTQGSSGTATNGSLLFNGAGNVSVGYSNGSVVISGAGGGGGGAAISAGTQSTNGGTVVFSNSNGVSFGMSNSSIITASVAQQTGISGIIVSNTTYTSGTVSFSNANGISFGSSAGQAITASYTVPSTAGLISAFKISGSAASVNATAMTFSNSNNVTLGLSTAANAGTLTASFALNVSATGGTSNAISGLTFKDSPNISFGLSTGVGVGTITASVPATSSLSATGGLSIAINASTISVGVVPVSKFLVGAANLTALTVPTNASMSIQYVPVPIPVSGSRIDALVAMSGGSGATAATGAIALSAYAIIYTKNASTLSSLSSGSTQTTYSYASNTAGQTQLTASAIRPVSVPVNFLMTQGEYFVGFNLITATSSVGTATTNYGLTLSMMGGNAIQTVLPYAEITANTATSTNWQGGMGMYSAATTGVPTAVSLSAINQTGSAISAANIAIAFRNV